MQTEGNGGKNLKIAKITGTREIASAGETNFLKREVEVKERERRRWEEKEEDVCHLLLSLC